jgi:hypothetical protein
LSLLKKLLFLYFCIFLSFSNSAYAVLINFDELDPLSYQGMPSGLPAPLSNEYESQGVLFKGNAYLLDWRGDGAPVSTPNYLGGPGFGLEFIDELPTYVSFYLSSTSHMAIYIDALGPNYTFQTTSSGEDHGGWPERVGSPYIHNEFFSLYSPTGISSIEFNSRGDAHIDDLIFTYSSPTQVPEPSALILFALGLLVVVVSRLKTSTYSLNSPLSGRSL